MKTEDEWFAENARRQRERLGLTQADVAASLQELGLSGFRPTTVSRIEKGDRSVKLAEAIRLAKVLGTSVATLASPTDDLLNGLEQSMRRWRDGRRDLVTAAINFHHDREVLWGDICTVEAALAGKERFPGDQLPEVRDRRATEVELEQARRNWAESAAAVVHEVEAELSGETAGAELWQRMQEQLNELEASAQSDDQ